MRSIVEIGQQGAEDIDVVAPEAQSAVEGVQPYLDIIRRFPATAIDGEVSDGTQRSIEVHALLLKNPQVFNLAWQAALYEPMVYARQGRRTVMGMLSPNFDTHGESRRGSIKVLPLSEAYPLTSRLLPDARMATMLAGAAHAEGEGTGGHDKPVTEDFEHRITISGAISLGKRSISQNGRHVNHKVRDENSVAAGLTNGRLGNIFVPDGAQTGEFTGYGDPLFFKPATVTENDILYFPKSFLESEQSFGAYYADAASIMYGASRQILYARYGQQAVSDRLKQIAEAA